MQFVWKRCISDELKRLAPPSNSCSNNKNTKKVKNFVQKSKKTNKIVEFFSWT